MDENIQRNLKQFLYLLKERKTMLVGDSSYNSLKYYINGYLHGISYCSDSNLNVEITEWLQKKQGKKFAVYWTDYIMYMADNEEEKANKMVLDIFEEFLEQEESI